MHVYAPGKHDYQVIAVKLDPQPWMKVAPTTYPPSEIYHFKELDEKVETYGKPFKLVQDVTVLNTAGREEGARRVADQVERHGSNTRRATTRSVTRRPKFRSALISR